MQEKITAFLSKTPEATAKKIAAGIGESDAQSSVNSALNAMRTDGIVECEKRKGKGNELVYWLAKPVCTNSQTESKLKQPAPVFTQPAHDNEIANLRAKLALAEKQRDDYFAFAESLQAALQKIDAKFSLIGTMLINIEGDSVEDKLGKVLHERLHTETKIADLGDDVRRHTESHNRLSTEISHFLTSVQQLTGIDHRPINLADSEEQIATAFNLMRGRVEELELAVDVAQQAVASMELAEEQGQIVDARMPAGYLVITPNKPPRRFSKAANADQIAAAAAKRSGIAEVFAIYQLKKAVRGVEWRTK